MKSLRIRIMLTWLCYTIMVVSLSFKAIVGIAICAIAVMAMRNLIQPVFPKRTRRRLAYWAMFLTVVVILMLGAWLEFADPWKLILVIGCWTLLAMSLAFQAYEDARVWQSERTAHAA